MNLTDSQTIKFLRFPLTFIVVMQHSMGTINTDISWQQLSGMDLYMLFKYLISGCFALMAVPVFFFISGYLFFNKVTALDMATYKQKMKKRFSSLFMPYIVWNILAVPIMLLVMYGETISGTRTMESLTAFIQEARWLHIFWDFTSRESTFHNIFDWPLVKDNPVLSTFWYIRDLLIMMVASPIIMWWFKRLGRWGLMILMALLVLRVWPPITLGPQSLFFAFGAYWAINGKDFTLTGNRLLRNLNYILSVVLLAVLVRLLGNDTYWGFQLVPLFTLSSMFAVISLGREIITRYPKFEFPKMLTDSSFFVYALHIEFALPLGFFISKSIFKGAEHPALLTLQYIITPCLIYLICLAAYQTLKKFTPRLLSILNGSR